MLMIPEDDIKFYKKRPAYYQLLQSNLERINYQLGNIEMTESQIKTWVWLAGCEERTVENILSVIEKVTRNDKERDKVN